MRHFFERNKPTFCPDKTLKDTLTFDNAYKEAVAEELAAKCSVEFNASSSGGNMTSHATVNTNQVESVNRVQNFSKRIGSSRSAVAKSYTCDLIPIAGKAEIPVTYGEQHFTLPVVVACGGWPVLLGKGWIQQI